MSGMSLRDFLEPGDEHVDLATGVRTTVPVEKIKVHVAVIEWSDDSQDPVLFAGRDLDRVETDIRSVIEHAVDAEHAYDEWEDYVIAHKGDNSEYQDWYDGLHDLGDSPWVTIETKEI